MALGSYVTSLINRDLGGRSYAHGVNNYSHPYETTADWLDPQVLEACPSIQMSLF